MNAKDLNALADRLADITEDAHGNPKPIDLSDRLEAARQLRLMAEVEARVKEFEADNAVVRDALLTLLEYTSGTAPLTAEIHETITAALNGNAGKELLACMDGTHRKIQEWWWHLDRYRISGEPVIGAVVADMESFMSERSIPLERPK